MTADKSGSAAAASRAAGDEDDAVIITENRGLLNFGKGRDEKKELSITLSPQNTPDVGSHFNDVCVGFCIC